MKKLGLFLGSFVGTIILCLTAWWLYLSQIPPSENNFARTADTLLLNMEFPVTNITDAMSGEPVPLTPTSLSDAVVIILGGIGCSNNQVEMLKEWNDNKMTVDSVEINIITLYADPLMGIELSRHEALLLRRASEVSFPALVYEGEEFNPRAMGIQTPQAVHVQNGQIVKVFSQKLSSAVNS